MRWEAQWTLLLFGSIAVLYWMAQAHTRPASILPKSAKEVAVDSTPTIAMTSSQLPGGIFQVKLDKSRQCNLLFSKGHLLRNVGAACSAYSIRG